MKHYTFRQCTLSILDNTFGLRETFSSSVLDSWLKMMPPISERERIVLESYQKLLLVNSNAWNEQELSLHFIGPLLGLVHFTEPYRFNLFAERQIKTVISGVDGDV